MKQLKLTRILLALAAPTLAIGLQASAPMPAQAQGKMEKMETKPQVVAAIFCYEWQGKRVSIFQAPCGKAEAGMLSVQRDEVSMVSWKQGDRTFALVAEASPEKSLQLARQVDEI